MTDKLTIDLSKVDDVREEDMSRAFHILSEYMEQISNMFPGSSLFLMVEHDKGTRAITVGDMPVERALMSMMELVALREEENESNRVDIMKRGAVN